jgi:hypothetical protein
MKRMLIIVGMLLGLATGVAQAQTRVGISLSFGDPYVGGHVVIGRPYYHRYSSPYYYHYYPRYEHPRYYHSPRVVVVRPHRGHGRRSHRRW